MPIGWRGTTFGPDKGGDGFGDLGCHRLTEFIARKSPISLRFPVVLAGGNPDGALLFHRKSGLAGICREV